MPQSTPGKLTRQQIYDRIRQSSKDEYILEEMIRLGFWPEGQEQPSPPEALIKRQGELERALSELISQRRVVEDPQRALKQMRKQRMVEARRKREENKIKQIQAAHVKALAWHQRRQKEIFFLGPDYSKGLNNALYQGEKLAGHNLPDLPDALSLANAMGISLSELRFLTFVRPTSEVNHYQRFEINKKTGGKRLISAPMPRLKRVQYWILDNILNCIRLTPSAHGFVAARSIVTNARPHIGAKVVINMDLRDFFPTITYPRIKGLFQALGYSEKIATLLALLCSEPDVEHIRLDGTAYFVGLGKRFLPQGAPTSPAISNILCCRMDRRLAGTAAQTGFRYTRYADDLTFSCDHPQAAESLQKLVWRVKQVTTDEGFVIHPEKTRIMHNGRRQEVTGLVVNQKLSIQRKNLKRFRALLFQIQKDGPQGKTWGQGGDLLKSIQGYANFVKMVDPVKGQQFSKQVQAIIKEYKIQTIEKDVRPLNKRKFRRCAAAGQPPRSDWWQVAQRPAPELVLPKRQGPQSGAGQTSSKPSQILETAAPEAVSASSWFSIRGCLKYTVLIICFILAFRVSPLMALILLFLFYWILK